MPASWLDILLPEATKVPPVPVGYRYRSQNGKYCEIYFNDLERDYFRTCGDSELGKIDAYLASIETQPCTTGRILQRTERKWRLRPEK